MSAPKRNAVPPAFPRLLREQSEDFAEMLAEDATPEEIAATQLEKAAYLLHEDKSEYPRFRWPRMHDAAGPMAPGELWLACARTGNGKTLFLLNVWADQIEEYQRCGFYIGLEQTPQEMRLKWACTMTGVPPMGPLGGKWPESWDEARILDAKAKVQRHMAKQRSDEIRALAHFSEARFIDAAKLTAMTEWAVDHGVEFVIVDHLNRLSADTGRNAFEGHSHIVRTAKELAVKYQIVMLCASQMGRPSGDPVQQFMPPALHEMRGGGTSEEEANVVLGIFRPLIPTISQKMLTDVRQGRLEVSKIYQENTMAVRVLKHRLDGLKLGEQVLLTVDRGRVLSLYERFDV